METSLEERIRRYLGWLRMEPTDEQLNLLAHHLELVIEKNKVINLTRITDPESAVVLHVMDSLLLLPAVEGAPHGRLLDVGTGAGYPGIPLAIMTGRQALLIDSVGKKVAAVREFIDQLELDDKASARQVRVEELARTEGGSFAVVTARAVAQTNVLVEYAAPLLVMGGRLVATKGHVSDEELAAGKAAADLCGLCLVSRETFELPEELGHREILTFEKVRRPHIKLPRNVGMAKHHPLGL